MIKHRCPRGGNKPKQNKSQPFADIGGAIIGTQLRLADEANKAAGGLSWQRPKDANQRAEGFCSSRRAKSFSLTRDQAVIPGWSEGPDPGISKFRVRALRAPECGRHKC